MLYPVIDFISLHQLKALQIRAGTLKLIAIPVFIISAQTHHKNVSLLWALTDFFPDRKESTWTGISADCIHPSPISTDSGLYSAGIVQYQHIATIQRGRNYFFHTSTENPAQDLVLNPGTWDTNNNEMLHLEQVYFPKRIPWHSFALRFKKHTRQKNG